MIELKRAQPLQKDGGEEARGFGGLKSKFGLCCRGFSPLQFVSGVSDPMNFSREMRMERLTAALPSRRPTGRPR